MAGGAIAAPFAAAGGALAGGVANVGGKIAIQIGASAAGGTVSGAGTQIIQNVVVADKKWYEDIGKAAGLGLFAGAVGGGLG